MRQYLSRYKGKRCFPLEHLMPVDNLNDKDFWITLNDDMKKFGDGWEVIENVCDGSASIIPDSAIGLYFFVWMPEVEFNTSKGKLEFGNVVYIGSSSTKNNGIKKRFISDYQSLIGNNYDVHWTTKTLDDRDKRLKKVLSLGRLHYLFNVMDGATERQILDMEERMIKLFNPPGNTQYAILRATLDKINERPAFN
ncbi:hypothetical protein JFQ93_000196 [Aeromonas sobria]|nr:hypothetical protein [Aeromonas sobria]